jgi:leucyl-tRNA synthetase
MNRDYDFQQIEKRWQSFWKEQELFRADLRSRKTILLPDHVPVPLRGAAHGARDQLHAGRHHYPLPDAAGASHLLSPMGWDSFGLPAENAAIRTGTHPQPFTEKNIGKMRAQMQRAGWGYDWSREVATSHPDYYRWTQWFFLQFYKHGLAVKKTAPVNWCDSCATVLANEQVHDGSCERCGTAVHQKDMSQWFFTMSRYAQRLLDGHDACVDAGPMPSWQCRKNGSDARKAPWSNSRVAETGAVPGLHHAARYAVRRHLHEHRPRAPAGRESGARHAARAGSDGRRHRDAAAGHQRRSELAEREKVGVWTGFHVINPVNGDKVPLWVANFALMSYGTGAVMAVPAHDQRDFEFARKYNLPVKVVIDRAETPLDGAP